jgi:hypothetical protein
MVMHVIDRSKRRECETRGQRPLNRIIVLPFDWGHSMDRIEQGFVVTALTGFWVLLAAATALAMW